MAQSSAQRDPSMEEILASIRRIIEEGEDLKQRAASAREDFEPTAIGPAANDAARSMPKQPPLEAVAVQTPAVALEPKIAPPVEALKPVEARAEPVEARVEPVEVRAEPIFDPVSDFSVSELRTTLDDVASDDEVSEEETLEFGETAETAEDLKLTLEDFSIDLHEVRPQAEREAFDPASRFGHVEFEAEEDAEASKSAIISERTGRQVAASFGELSEAFAASRRRSFDEMAEEMIRPMLQDWLDNNLPTLVERLVREEIERVARGGTN